MAGYYLRIMSPNLVARMGTFLPHLAIFFIQKHLPQRHRAPETLSKLSEAENRLDSWFCQNSFIQARVSAMPSVYPLLAPKNKSTWRTARFTLLLLSATSRRTSLWILVWRCYAHLRPVMTVMFGATMWVWFWDNSDSTDRIYGIIFWEREIRRICDGEAMTRHTGEVDVHHIGGFSRWARAIMYNALGMWVPNNWESVQQPTADFTIILHCWWAHRRFDASKSMETKPWEK